MNVIKFQISNRKKTKPITLRTKYFWKKNWKQILDSAWEV